MRARTLLRSGVFAAALLLALAMVTAAASAVPVLHVGTPDYASRTVPFAVVATDGVTSVTFELQPESRPAETFSASESSPGSFTFETVLSSDETVVARAFAGEVEVWAETLRLTRASFAPGRPTLSLRHDQLIAPGRALTGTCDSKTSTITVQVKRRTHWSTVWSGPAVLDANGRFALDGIKLPAGHSWVRVTASNGFGSSPSKQQSVYSLGRVAGYSRLVLVDKSDTRLWVIRGGIVKFTCRCAVGMPWTPTPTGTFRLGKRHKTPNPYWGPWRLRLWRRVKVNGVVRSVKTKYFIHGTSVPSSIGDWASHGCIRLHNKNIRKLSTVIDGYTAIIRE